MRLWICGILLCALCATSTAQTKENACAECALPKAPNHMVNYADLVLKNGRYLYNVVSLKRTTIQRFNTELQAVKVSMLTNGVCSDTTVATSDIRRVQITSLGPGGGTISTPIFPAREFYSTTHVERFPSSFLEVTPTVFITGNGESVRNVQFGNPLLAGEFLVAPFGRMLGESAQLALGASVFWEGGRMRVPAIGHIRYTLFGAPRDEVSTAILPNACTFRRRDTSSIADIVFEPASAVPVSAEYTEVTSNEERDSTVFYVQRQTQTRSDFRPFVFAEGGIILNGSFEGAGAMPSLNSEDYGQYLLGVGIGAPLPWVPWLTASIGYRYMRLNLRTPCASCPPEQTGNPDNYYFLNTNQAHGLFVKFGARLEWGR